MAPLVYLETSIISYLAARPTSDLITDARQRLTQAWWLTRRAEFDLAASQLVVDEASAGDPDAARRRLEYLDGVPLLDITAEAIGLAQSVQQLAQIPQRAAADALHVALATIHGVDYLLTWNMRHIANAELRPRIDEACREVGFIPPTICTPDEFMGGLADD